MKRKIIKNDNNNKSIIKENKKGGILAIFGSRSLYNMKVKNILRKEIERFSPDVLLIPGEINGVCKLGRELGKELGITSKLFFPDKKKAGGQYHYRSLSILHEADFVLLIYDGKSKGTKHEYELVKQLKKKSKIIECKDFEFDNIFNEIPVDLL